MTAKEFKEAFIIANADVTIDENTHPIDPFNGFGLEGFEPINVTLEQVARIIRWQAHFMDGTWDQNELENIKYFGRKRFIICS